MDSFKDKMAAAKAAKAASLPSTDALAKQIRSILEDNGTYQPSLDFAIQTAAGSYRSFLLASADVAKLSKTWYQTLTREGNKKLEKHPAISTMKDCQQMTIDALKCLGLTLQELTASPNDPFATLMNNFSDNND